MWNFVQPCWCSGERCNTKPPPLMQAGTAAWESLHSQRAASLTFQSVAMHVFPHRLRMRRTEGAVELAEGRLHQQGLKSDCQDPQKKCRITGDFWKAETNRETSSTLMERVTTAAEADLLVRPATWT